MVRVLGAVLASGVLVLGGCGSRAAEVANAAGGTEPAQAKPVGPREIHAIGTIQAVRAFTVQVPRIEAQQNQQGQGGGRLTLVKLTGNGATVKQGDVLAEFDRTAEIDAAREAKAKHEDLQHQVRQKAAENRSESEKRALELREAEADLGKALIELRKGPVLAEIERLKNQAKADSARDRVESLKQIDAHRRRAEAAALRILELQTERQKVALDRANSNAEKLVVHAPIGGMVALENLWRGGSMGNAQEGDQLWPGQALLKIFDPARMQVNALISEPDRAALGPGTIALVRLDAYPETAFRAHFDSASPVATSALGSPIKNFAARFQLEQTDSRMLPDLSAAVVIRAQEKQP